MRVLTDAEFFDGGGVPEQIDMECDLFAAASTGIRTWADPEHAAVAAVTIIEMEGRWWVHPDVMLEIVQYMSEPFEGML